MQLLDDVHELAREMRTEFDRRWWLYGGVAFAWLGVLLMTGWGEGLAAWYWG